MPLGKALFLAKLNPLSSEADEAVFLFIPLFLPPEPNLASFLAFLAFALERYKKKKKKHIMIKIKNYEQIKRKTIKKLNKYPHLFNLIVRETYPPFSEALRF